MPDRRTAVRAAPLYSDVDEYPEEPPRGDAIEIPGEPVTLEYEEIRSAPPWLTPMAIIVVTLFAVFVVARAAVIDDREPIELSQIPAGSAPTALADGSALPEIPPALAQRFAAPVVGTTSVTNVPPSLSEQCATPFAPEQLDPAAHRRITQVVQTGTVTELRLGPEALSVLRTGVGASPPEWPDTWVLSCLGRLQDGAWVARPPRLDFAVHGGVGAADSEAGAALRLVNTPEDATWAAQERDGWWLLTPVQPESWAQLMVPMADRNAEIRVVFLNDGGDVLADERLAPPADASLLAAEDAEAVRTGAGTFEAGSVDEILAATQEGPIQRCDQRIGQCVWLTRVGSEVQAYAAYGPHHLDVPPFGELGWCPDGRRFQGTVTRSQLLPNGSWRGGIAPRGADSFPLRFSGGRVIVDLGQPQRGEPAGETGRFSNLCVFDGDPVGSPAEDPDAIQPLG